MKRCAGDPPTWIPVVALLASALALGACAGGPPPAPSAIVADAPDVEAAGPAARDPELRLSAGGLRPVAAPAPPPALPWIPPVLSLDPAEPVEGQVVALRLRRVPASRLPLSLEGSLDGRPLLFRSTGDGWIALGALPVESAGERELEILFRISPDSVERWSVPLSVRARDWPSARLRINSRTAGADPELTERLQRERILIRSTLERATPEWLADGRFGWPRRDRVTSPFGQRRMFDGQVRSRHLGLDLAGRPGAPVEAAASGRVALTGRFHLQGNAVYLDHGMGVYTAYFHLSRIDVAPGEMVGSGQPLGAVGSTGRVTGPHLHWSLYVGGVAVDPASLLGLDLPPAPAPPQAVGAAR